MSNVTVPNPTSTDESTDTPREAEDRCAACRHRWEAHDAIGVRFCAATLANGTERGCVCVAEGRD
jgi:hypothetical protein